MSTDAYVQAKRELQLQTQEPEITILCQEARLHYCSPTNAKDNRISVIQVWKRLQLRPLIGFLLKGRMHSTYAISGNCAQACS